MKTTTPYTDFIRSKIISDDNNRGVINSLKSNTKLGKGEWAILESMSFMEA